MKEVHPVPPSSNPVLSFPACYRLSIDSCLLLPVLIHSLPSPNHLQAFQTCPVLHFTSAIELRVSTMQAA
jgi:hypothetical protein